MESIIRERLESEFVNAQVELQINGNRAVIKVISEVFEGSSRVQRQQRVYGCLSELIQSGELHAVTIEAKTPQEL